MRQLTVYSDPTTPDQRVYQVDEQVAGEAFGDMLDAFRGDAFQHDLGVEALGSKPKHNIPAKLKAIVGITRIAFASPNYIIFKRDGVSWEGIDPEVRRVLAEAFGGIEKVIIIDGPLA